MYSIWNSICILYGYVYDLTSIKEKRDHKFETEPRGIYWVGMERREGGKICSYTNLKKLKNTDLEMQMKSSL